MNLIENRNNLLEVIRTLKKLHTKKTKKSYVKQLFDDDSDGLRCRIDLMLSLCKIPDIPEDGKVQPVTIRGAVPHSFVDDLTDILLITKNLKGYKKEFDHSVAAYQDLLREHNALNLITQVMTIGQLRYEHSDYEAKRALSSRFEIVLCDDVIYKLVPRLLGKSFYSKKKCPIAISMKAKDLRKEILNALSKAYMHMNLAGSSAMAQIAQFNQTNEDIADNIVAFVETLKKRIPGGWANVRSLHLKTDISKSLPLYISTVSPDEIPIVKHPNEKEDAVAVAEPLSTIGDQIVAVYRSGKVTVVPKTKVPLHRFLAKLKRKELKRFDRYDPHNNKVIKGTVRKDSNTNTKQKRRKIYKRQYAAKTAAVQKDFQSDAEHNDKKTKALQKDRKVGNKHKLTQTTVVQKAKGMTKAVKKGTKAGTVQNGKTRTVVKKGLKSRNRGSHRSINKG